MPRPTSAANFIVEIQGVASVLASEVSGIKKEHTEFEHYVGNDPLAQIGRGTAKCGDVTIAQAWAVNDAGKELFDWMDAFISGDNVEYRTIRVIQMDSTRRVPVATYELIDCLPKSFEQENNDGKSNDAAKFKLMVRPTDIRLL